MALIKTMNKMGVILPTIMSYLCLLCSYAVLQLPVVFILYKIAEFIGSSM